MEVIMATALPNAVLVALSTLYLLQREGPNKLEDGPGYTGIRLDGYSPKIWSQVLTSTRGGGPRFAEYSLAASTHRGTTLLYTVRSST